MQSHVTSVMEVWKSLYETANIHMGLVVTETNLCAELVCTSLYAAYGQYVSALYDIVFEVQLMEVAFFVLTGGKFRSREKSFKNEDFVEKSPTFLLALWVGWRRETFRV